MWDASYVHSPLQPPYHPSGWERMASLVVMIPNLLMPVSHPGDLSLNVQHINMIKCNSSDTEVDHACQAANKRLQRTYPSSSCKVNGLLRRNYWIIKKADTVYAFGKFAQNSQGLECVDGGMGWGVEMARLMHKPWYLCSMTHNHWFEYDRVEDRFEACFEPIVSLMGKTCAIIGTRNMEAHTDPWRSLQNMFSIHWGSRAPMKSKIYHSVIGS